MDPQAKLVETLRLHHASFRGAAVLRTPFYEALCDEFVRDVEAGGPVGDILAPYAADEFEAAYVLRLLGGLHRLALRGAAPDLAADYPSTGGDGDAAAAMAAVRAVLADPPADITIVLSRPPQTNDVARSAALASGFLVVAKETGAALRLREIGSSGGFNLRPESYWYEHDGAGWGNAASPVRFVDLWSGGAPPFADGAEIVDRRGCDLNPIDPTTEDGVWTLLSYVWPEPAERFTRTRDAIALARSVPVDVDAVNAAAWVGAQLTEPRRDAIVFFHSVVWQYIDAPTQDSIREQIEGAGRVATADAPVAWLRLEPRPVTYAPAELRLTLWDGNDEPRAWLLVETSFHGGPITWLEEPV